MGRTPRLPGVYDYQELFDRTDLDLVVNASFSDTHCSITKDLLAHGMNMVVKKPMACNYYECCDLINTAKQQGGCKARSCCLQAMMPISWYLMTISILCRYLREDS
ncbi:MAG: Gfo/Idh/MocA family oxidoreductase [Peptococcaceae bacterium]|nr:Gfo/Idh/MocA family oxidoreductase [Peptococcaceae bacterium]